MNTEITTVMTEALDGAATVTTAAADLITDTAATEIITDTAAVTEGGGLINVGGFLDTLPMMAKGMLGIFAVTLVIIGAIYLLGLIKGRDK